MIGNLSVIRNEGYRALTRELGVAGTVLFIRQLENGRGNYTEERRAMLDKSALDEIAERIKKRNA